MARRLPVYLLLDCSSSMSGDPIDSVRQGVETLHATLLANPMAMDTAYLSVITFASTAVEAVPLTNLFNFQPPAIGASGTTAMGQALNLLCDCVDRDVQRKKSESERGDYRPLVFLFTDGHPTDTGFAEAAKRVRDRKWGRFVACAGGRNADINKLLTITPDVLLMENISKDALEAFFDWVSGSIASSITNEGQLAPLPGGVNLVKAPPAAGQTLPRTM